MCPKMNAEHPRISREKKTIEAMVHIYCKNHHGSKGELCPECSELFEYAKMRLDKCPFKEKKSTCGKCLVHCYQPQMREKVKTVMKYSGPRMLLHHPVLALHHVVDGRKKPEKLNKKKR
jgi:predicted amidophosphoribosyltransferase